MQNEKAPFAIFFFYSVFCLTSIYPSLSENVLVAAIFAFILILVLASWYFGSSAKKKKVNTELLIYSQQFKKYYVIHFSILWLCVQTPEELKM